MRITVFGGHGFLGRYVVQRLARAGHLVRVAVRHSTQANFLRPMGNIGQITPVDCDLKNAQSVKLALTGVDAAINLVGILSERGRQTFRAVHDEAVHTLVDQAQAARLEQLIHVSAIGAAPDSAAAYARTKAAGEAHVRQSQLNWTIIRPSVIFGPEDQFLNFFAKLAMMTHALPLIGGGQTRLQPVYVADVADCILACLGAPQVYQQIYELGGPQVFTFKQLLEQLLKWIHRDAWFVPIPFAVAQVMGYVNALLPKPLITADQVKLLRYDNVVTGQCPGFEAFGISPKAVEVIAPNYLQRYQRMG